ncbi:FAD-dependent oxidoreductase [Alcanivorax sp. 521-1]|uniref:FAD-dependent oxidoreductase n=1 Tax=Alloalcanivorax profundimaris TaxID=2735259 RepID=A0ABS0AVE1_9GAMM|nr:D-arabinono-1,4-lactone oxidase [Alloalcanivorax profundimaris]MBF5058112.1 FAD-dependent oxidoreductase [Alloalcanivorax profundimaris]
MAFNLSLDRRGFLKALAATAGAGALPGLARASEQAAGGQWQNWSGNQSARPRDLAYPATEDALKQLLAATSGTVRAFGGSHSFSGVVPTDDTLVSLEAMAGLRGRDGDVLHFGAGTRIAQAGAQAWGEGQSLINEPDINLQSLAGAIATSTHGTGLGLPSLSAQVDGLTLLDMAGRRHRLTAKDGELFDAARCSVGALGLVTEVSLRTEPAYRLEEHTWTLPLDEAMDFVEREKDSFRNIEFFAFPLGGTAIVKTMTPTDREDDNLAQDDSNDLLEMVSELAMRAGWLTSTLQKLVTFFVEENRRWGPAHKIYANRRTVRFNEMEYTVPAERGVDCLRQVCETIRERDINVFFPIEFRYVAADDTLLSMFSGRPGASISVHQYYKQDYRPLFEATEPVLRDCQGRPHWGKLHGLGAAELRALYPGFDDFLAIRRELDPDGRLLNDHLKRLFLENG